MTDASRRIVDGSAWYGRWLSALLETLAEQDSERVTVIGWSLGAAVVLASASPRVERQVLVSPGGVVRLRTPPAVLAAGAGWAMRRRVADSRRLLQLMHGPGFVPRPALVEWMTLVARHVRSSADPGPSPVAADVERVAISGECDIFLPPARLAPRLHRLSAALHVVPGGGHLLAEEDPEAVAALAVPGP